MTFQSVLSFSEMFSLILFVSLFVIAVGYALWPGNATKFEHAARVPLEADANGQPDGGTDEH